jgi:hypothetical protein
MNVEEPVFENDNEHIPIRTWFNSVLKKNENVGKANVFQCADGDNSAIFKVTFKKGDGQVIHRF